MRVVGLGFLRGPSWRWEMVLKPSNTMSESDTKRLLFCVYTKLVRRTLVCFFCQLALIRILDVVSLHSVAPCVCVVHAYICVFVCVCGVRVKQTHLPAGF